MTPEDAPENCVEYSSENAVAYITLNRPNTGNALNAELALALSDSFDTALRAGMRLIVLRGAGKHFCTGFDLGEIANSSDGDLLLRFVRIEQLLQRVYRSPVMTVAIGSGRVYGAGADLFTACDRRIALPGSTYAFPGSAFGLVLGTRRLAARIGNDAARRLLIDGRVLSDTEASGLALATDRCEFASLEAMFAKFAEDSTRLSAETISTLHEVTCLRDDTADLAALVNSASIPGLKDRIRVYRDRVTRQRDRTSSVGSSR
jgi:enoyl-CoA hydratase/carnithine racemase